MKNKIFLLALALGASTSLLLAQDATPPADAQQPPAGEHGPRGSRGWLHLLPPGAEQRLALTDDQKKQIADLESDVKARLQKILTADQLAQLKKMHPPRRGGGPGGEGGYGGPDGGPDGGPNGGPGGPGGGPGDGPAGGPDGAPAGPGGDAHPANPNQ